jgi:hypothetical protein
MIIAIIRGSISGPPAVLAAHLVANMTENIGLLHFLNLFLVLSSSSCDPRELHVSLCKYRSHLVLPYRTSPLRLLACGLAARQLLQPHIFVHLIKVILKRIFRISSKELIVDAPPAIQKWPRRCGDPTYVRMRHVDYGCIALTFAPLDFGAVVVLRLAWL